MTVDGFDFQRKRTRTGGMEAGRVEDLSHEADIRVAIEMTDIGWRAEPAPFLPSGSRGEADQRAAEKPEARTAVCQESKHGEGRKGWPEEAARAKRVRQGDADGHRRGDDEKGSPAKPFRDRHAISTNKKPWSSFTRET